MSVSFARSTACGNARSTLCGIYEMSFQSWVCPMKPDEHSVVNPRRAWSSPLISRFVGHPGCVWA